jgi:hypothetical protein
MSDPETPLIFLAGLLGGILAGCFLGLGLAAIDDPNCTAYQAIDGKPVCIEYQPNKPTE